jgi:hypothetical protein
MEKSQRRRVAAYVMAGVLVGALGSWGVQELLELAGEQDERLSRGSFQNQLMRRKADALHDLLDGLVDGKLDRVEDAAGRVKANAKGIESYLLTDIYVRHGDAFFEAVDDVQRAAGREDLETAKEAALRLERSCIECHMLLNEGPTTLPAP